jgi:hypothetical protein
MDGSSTRGNLEGARGEWRRMLRGVGLPSAPSCGICTRCPRVNLSTRPPSSREPARGGATRGWIPRVEGTLSAAQSDGVEARGSTVRTMDGTRENIDGRHCGSPGCGDAAQSRIAERTVIDALSARVRRDPQHQAAELSWACERRRDPSAESAWMVHWARPARAGNPEARLSDSRSAGALISERPRRACAQTEDSECG